jgi:hypothetical protein
MVLTWFRHLARARSRPFPRGRRIRAGRRAGFRPGLEALENFQMPTPHQWTGAVGRPVNIPGENGLRHAGTARTQT